ncbi:MAG: hypothetical protein ND866_23990 [Pyrinomonadaceae bacterium]|nr:hypothetical protein [Pyrinomonadaceae bacterium]
MKVTRRHVAIIGIAAATSASELSRTTTSKAHPRDAHGGASEIQVAGDVQHEDAARGAIPRRGAQARAESSARILWHPHNLKTPLALRPRGCGVGISVKQAVTCTCSPNRNSSSGWSGGNNVFVTAGIIEGSRAACGGAGDSIAI